MVVGSSSSTRQGMATWIGGATTTRVEFDRQSVSSSSSSSSVSEATANNMLKQEESCSSDQQQSDYHPEPLSDVNLGFAVRAISAAGAAVVSAVLVNPLDVAKTRLQAQAAGVPYNGLCGAACFENPMLPDTSRNPSYSPAVFGGEACPPECARYKGTLDVFYKVVREEGFTRLWRGTNASLALAVPSVGIYLPCYDVFRNFMEDYTSQNAPTLTPYVPLVAGSLARSIACISCYPIELARTRMQAFKSTQNGAKPPGVWKTLVEVLSPVNGTNGKNLQNYRILWTGLGAQLARDVPFSAICWSTLEPVRKRILGFVGNDASGTSIFGANFCAGFIAGSLAAAVTCPLDVARTWQQIENDPERALKMTTRKTLVEIWRDGGVKGLFTGVGPRVARAGPSVGIVVSFYEVVKYVLHQRHSTS